MPIRQLLAALLPLAAAFFSTSAGARAQSADYELKAAFLIKFTQFVKWPASAFPNSGAPFTIGLVGGDPFGGALDKAVEGETVGGRKIVVRKGGGPGCQMVFVSKGTSGAGAGPGVLTVGESSGFARYGGIIEFTPQGSSLGFDINVGNARRAGLEISSKLLKLGRVVQ